MYFQSVSQVFHKNKEYIFFLDNCHKIAFKNSAWQQMLRLDVSVMFLRCYFKCTSVNPVALWLEKKHFQVQLFHILSP